MKKKMEKKLKKKLKFFFSVFFPFFSHFFFIFFFQSLNIQYDAIATYLFWCLSKRWHLMQSFNPTNISIHIECWEIEKKNEKKNGKKTEKKTEILFFQFFFHFFFFHFFSISQHSIWRSRNLLFWYLSNRWHYVQSFKNSTKNDTAPSIH